MVIRWQRNKSYREKVLALTQKQKLSAKLGLFPGADYTGCAVRAQVLFERFFCNDLTALICDRPNAYAVLHSGNNSNITPNQ